MRNIDENHTNPKREPGRHDPVCKNLRSWQDDSYYGRTDQDEIDTRNEILKKLAKVSILRFVSPEESAVAPQSSSPVKIISFDTPHG